MTPSFLEIPLVELTQPREGFTLVSNRWWATQNGNPIPCCHADRDALQEWAAERGLGITFVPVAFWPGAVPA